MKNLPLKAKLYILPIILVGIVLSAINVWGFDLKNLPMMVALSTLAAFAQVIKVEGKTNKSNYNVSFLVYGFSFLLLGIPTTIFIILVAYLVEWAWHKYPWYISTFNIAVMSVSISVAGWVCKWINPLQDPLTISGTLGLIAGLMVFTFINHLLVGMVIWLAREQNFRQSGIFGLLSLMIDFTIMSLGVVTALIWKVNPTAAIFTIIPLYLIYNTLRVPQLERETEIDVKTKLYNARYFASALEQEMGRSERFDRPLTVVMGDLDLLRNINNTYGHLAGDVVICGVAEVLQENFNGFNVVSRFGGEEFAIMLPEITPEQAYKRVEKVRKAIENKAFEVSTSVTPIQITMSFGIAGRDEGAATANEIVHNADVALYHVKLNGRNKSYIYTPENIEALFKFEKNETQQIPDKPSLQDRLGENNLPYQPNPLRNRTEGKTEESSEPSQSAVEIKTYPSWVVSVYISLLTLISVGLIAVVFRPASDFDWVGLALFGLCVVITEGLSVNIYVKDASISTSAAVFIAGVLLLGPMGAIILSFILAGTSWIKKRSQPVRFVFNANNHLISSTMVSVVISLTGREYIAQPVLTQLVLAVIAGGVIFISSTTLLSVVMGFSMGNPILNIWKQQFSWLWSYYIAFGFTAFAMIQGFQFGGIWGFFAILVPILMLRYSQVQYINRTKNLVNQLQTTNKDLEQQRNQITALNEDLLLSLANVIDLRDPSTMGHSQRVAEIAALIAEELGLSRDRVELISKAGLLHDIGKLGIPELILFKPDHLSKYEYEIIKQHPVLGAKLIEANNSAQGLFPIIKHHHERYDGRGYPDGLTGEEIPLEARIVGLADAVEAMSSDRSYRKGLSIEDILREISINSGTQFDPEVVKVFLLCMHKQGSSALVNSVFSQQENKPAFENVYHLYK
jgi:diguanylate cyclase (GGDEF)-like protein/putative nucleotidyltransferase with HDIG domain